MKRLTIGVGFESLKDPAQIDHIANKMDAAGAGGVTIAVGRPDWVAFPWEAHRDTWALSTTTEDDPFGAALTKLSTDKAGKKREVTVVIDALAPDMIKRNPEEAGVNRWGEASTLFPNGPAYYSGTVGKRIVELCGEVAKRYQPDRIGLTELILDSSFSEADKALYHHITGHRDWPRNDEGEIEFQHPTVHTYRSEVVADLVRRCRAAAAPYGVEIDTDVRAAWDDPNEDRSDSGHDYELLLKSGHHITVWNYFEMNDRPASYSKNLTLGLYRQVGRHGIDNVTMSVGLWAGGDSDLAGSNQSEKTVSPRAMADGVRASLTNGVTRVSVTPASKMTDEHWAELGRMTWG